MNWAGLAHSISPAINASRIYSTLHSHIYVFIKNATAFYESSLRKGETTSLQREGKEEISYHRGSRLPEGVSEAWHDANNKRGKMTIRYSMKLVSPTAVYAVAKILSDDSYPLSLRKAAGQTGLRPTMCPPEEVLAGATFTEGNVVRIAVNRYERDSRAREACISRYGTVCCVCGFDFVATYGEVMAGFTHVHHLDRWRRSGGLSG